MRKKINTLQRIASFKPETYDEKTRTMDVVFSTGEQVKRTDFWSGDPWIEELSMSRKHVKLDRLNAGANVLNSHRVYGGLEQILGVVEKARIEKEDERNVGVATIRFSERPEIQSIISDIRSGIIRQISAGYTVHKFEEQKAQDGVRVFRAIDWEPREISFVTAAAEIGARVRSDSEESNDCEFILRGDETMVRTAETSTAPTATAPAATAPESVRSPEVNTEAVRADAAKAERERIAEIQNSCRGLGISDDFAKKLVDDGVKLDAARSAIIAERMKNEKPVQSATNVEVTRTKEETEVRGFAEALAHRANPVRNKLTDLGREFRAMSLTDMARACLENQGIKTRGLTKDEIVRKAFVARLQRSGDLSTSDFPLLMENLITKTLRDAYQESPAVYQPITRQTTAPDFKQVSRAQLGDAPDLDLLPENGEIQTGKIGQGAEKFALETYAKMIRIGRKTIVNDDLDSLTRLPENFGRRARQKESDLVWTVILANAALADAVALFHATHGNLSLGGAAAIAIASIGAARSGMRKQRGIGDDTNASRMSLNPLYLFVPPELETVADQFVTQITPDAAGSVNPFANRLKVLVEPRLSDAAFHASASATAWYLTADIAQVDILELMRLQGDEGPVIESEDMFDTEGMKIKCRIDLAAKAIDYRGLQKNAGV